MLEEIVHSFEEEIKGKVGYLSSSGTDQIDAKIYAKLRYGGHVYPLCPAGNIFPIAADLFHSIQRTIYVRACLI